MGTWAGTGEAFWPGTLPVMSPLPPLAMGATDNSGAHGEAYSTHTYAFKHSCVNDSHNEPTAARHENRDERSHNFPVCGM